MRLWHFAFLALIFLAGVSTAGTVRQYVTFLPQW